MAPTIVIIGGGPSGLTLARLLECNDIDYVVYERNISENSPPGQGGSLDIHGATGQEALKRGGLSAEFEKLARRDATVAQIADKGKQLVKFGEDRDAPEIDRVQLRKLLLNSIPSHKIQWNKAVTQVKRDSEGNVVLHFADGTNATGFRLVVGADGAWSKVRHLLTPAKPKYSGKSYIEGKISPGNSFYRQVEARVGHGSMLAFGLRKHLAVQQMSDGSYRIYLGLTVDENAFAVGNPNVDLVADNGTLARQFFLSQPGYFADWDSELKGIIANSEGGFRYWPLYHMAPDSLNWEHAPQVTLIGDAAHVSTPFVGEGVNCAMYDALVLLEKILEFGTGDGLDRAVAEYEMDMFKRGRDLIERSMESAELLFAEDAPNGLVQIIQGSSE
ncbi:uncharacterized protein NECHADRAFT_90693 [Fusarium vanettenii 77-13-4]|uniref:FAD-binding domain-containing protein n=1 Tax=Fusarium vanettenii (strain ATCC MYA-4622 / CBS 123669 / FGSC 9596 / NRRL 45880 / 77-13-4) TaxID=660122 RepID=C7Z659_FUSV7|nr:uncharacterized protein NECHADRAFT_90693 [Fusarium vanettenii 77-13-4]EEU40070.1 hypothetical protein NECHADRAFT_90693 [Fusarium vanettenii 77-13-4]